MRVTKYVLMFPVSGVMWRNFKIMFIKSLQLQRKCIWYMYGKVQETQIFRQIDNCLSTERIINQCYRNTRKKYLPLSTELRIITFVPFCAFLYLARFQNEYIPFEGGVVIRIL